MERLLSRLEEAPPELQIRTLGQVGVWVGGRPARWGAHSAEALFFYLLSYPEGRRKEEILEALWGLDPSPMANNRFRVTVFRVRATLAHPGAIVEAYGRYRLAEAVLQSSDLFAFYQALRQAQQARCEVVRLQRYQEALALYQGDYLPGFNNNWAAQAREEHKNAYIQALLETALIHQNREDWAAASHYLERALQADPYLGENYHQQLMWCLAAAGERYRAIEHYRRFVRFLHEELGDTPMPETRELAERIKHHALLLPHRQNNEPVRESLPARAAAPF